VSSFPNGVPSVQIQNRNTHMGTLSKNYITYLFLFSKIHYQKLFTPEEIASKIPMIVELKATVVLSQQHSTHQ
jgi:hypothetical protein